MARKKKNRTLEEELLELRQEAERCDEEIKRLTDRKKSIKQLIEIKQTEALYQAVQDSGKTVEEAIALINGEGQAEEGQE